MPSPETPVTRRKGLNMLIESIIRRAKGTRITLGVATYVFAPDKDGRHVAEVEDAGHVATLLSIREGYRPADGSIIAAAANIPAIDGPFFIIRGPQDATALAQWASAIPDMSIPPSEIDEHVLLIDKIALGEASYGPYAPPIDSPVSPAPVSAITPAASGPSPQTPPVTSILPTDQNQAGDGAGAAGSDAHAPGDGGAGAAGGAGADSFGGTALPDRDELAERYAKIHGHRPNGKWSAEKIAQVLDQQE